MSAFALRCLVCHHKLPLWYIFVIVFVIASLAGFMLLLEQV
jgi:hypothetical protein